MTTQVDALRVKIFADGADIAGIAEMAREPWVKGFTTNPTLMRKAGVTDYEAFSRSVLEVVRGRKPAHQRERQLIAEFEPNLNTF